jgi:hypothetical protein
MVICKAEAGECWGAIVARGGCGIVRARVTHNHVRYWCMGLVYDLVLMTSLVWLWQ